MISDFIKKKLKGEDIICGILGISFFFVLSYLTNTDYRKWKRTNFFTNKNTQRIYINERTTLDELCDILVKNNIVKNVDDFKSCWNIRRCERFLCRKYSKSPTVKPGSYILKTNSTNEDVVTKLRSGTQDPISLRIPQLDTKKQFSEYVSKHLMMRSADLLEVLNDDKFLKQFNTDKNHIMNTIISNTYSYYWNISPQQLVVKLTNEYKTFWNSNRLTKAKNIGLSQDEVMILASIVEKEIANIDEASTIAGIYMNRLRRKMRLEADPTLQYAIKYEYNNNANCSNFHTLKSEYNTYYKRGLPCGVITTPSTVCIDAVLNYKHHNYLYFVVSEDKKHHIFSEGYDDHLRHVRRYRKHKK